MSWRDRLTHASFRGFDFLTESHDAKGGRRLVVKELPGAEFPEVEDLGGKAWDWRLNCYFLGQDYDLARNGFLAKLAEPGADWLNHPWLGPLWVRAKSWSVQESNDKGGYCTVSVEFVEGGSSLQPTTDRVDVVFSRLTALSTVAVDSFELEPMSAGGMTAFVAAVSERLEVLRKGIALATLPLTWAGQVRGLIDGAKGDLAALMAVPRQYAVALDGMANVLGTGGDEAGLADTDRPRVIRRLLNSAALGASVGMFGTATTEGAVRRNLLREDDLRQGLLVSAAARVAVADYRAADDRDAALAAAVRGLESLLPLAADPVFDAAAAARAALIDALMAQNLSPVQVREVAGALPAVVLAHRMGVDEEVFVARNGVVHPLFVSGRVHG